jgi:hypothetical protein
VILTAAALLAACAAAPASRFGGKDTGGKKGKPEPLPAEAVAAWENAGAEQGKIKAYDIFLVFSAGKNRPGSGEVPAFRFKAWKEGITDKLTDPGVPFGVAMQKTKVPEAAFKAMAGWKSLRMVDLLEAELTDAGLKELGGCKGLTGLNFRGAWGFTDAGVAGLAPLADLQFLGLGSGGVTDKSLKTVATFKQLRGLSLWGAKVGVAGVKELTALAELRHLELTASGADDACLKVVARLDKLETLIVGGVEVTDAGMKDVAALKQLRILNIDHTAVTDAGIKELAACKNLTVLGAYGIKLTDAGLKDLATIQSLSVLDARGTMVTEEGIKQFRKALPRCAVSWKD